MIRISVCMATYNGERFVKKQIESILAQLGTEDELIISDDSSRDNTLTVISQFDDERVRVFANRSTRSATHNFENALNHASGDVIFLADQDDIWYPHKVSCVLSELERFDLVVSDCTFINSNDQIIGESYFKAYNSGKGLVKNFIKNTYLGNCMAFRRTVLTKVLPFPVSLHKASRFSLYHDVWIGLVGDIWFRVCFIPPKLSAYRRHSDNASPTGMNAKSPNALWIKIKVRYLLATGLIGRAVGLL